MLELASHVYTTCNFYRQWQKAVSPNSYFSQLTRQWAEPKSAVFFLPNCCTWHLTLGRPAFSTPLSPRRQFSVPHKPQFQQHVCCLLVLNPCKRNVLNLAIIPILAIKAVFTVFAMIVYNSDLLTLLTYRPHSNRGMRTQKSSRPVSLQAGLDWSQAPRQAHLFLQAPYITWKSDWFFGTGVSRSVLISKKNLQAFKWQSGAPLKLSFDHFNSLSMWSSICGANMESHMAPKMSVFGRIFWTESPCSVCAVDLGVDGAVVVPQAEDSGGRKRLIKKLI